MEAVCLLYRLHVYVLQGADSVVECVYNDSTAAVVVQSSWNVNGHSNAVNSDVRVNSMSTFSSRLTR